MSKQRSGYSVLIRNLLETTTPEVVREAFEKFGEIRDVYLPTDFFSQKPRGFGFVEFYNLDSAKEAVKEMDNAVVDGATISVTPAQDRRKSPESMRRVAARNQGSHIPYGKSHGDRHPNGARMRDRPEWSNRPLKHDRWDRFSSNYRNSRSSSIERYNRYNGDRPSIYDLDDRRYDERRYNDRRYEDRRYGDRRYNNRRYDDYESKWIGREKTRGLHRGGKDRGDSRDVPARNRYPPRHNDHDNSPRKNARDDKESDNFHEEKEKAKSQTMNLDQDGPVTDSGYGQPNSDQ